MRTPLFLFLTFAVLVGGCFPGGSRQRTIAGDFRLEQWEDGDTYYLRRRGHNAEGGGIFGGTVLRIGWNSRYIVAERYSIFRGDPDGWMIIDVQTGKITGPFSDAELQGHSEVRGITTYPVSEAWRRL